MIELKPLKKMMLEYRKMVEKYEVCLNSFTIDDYKRFIGEIKLFWYRNQEFTDYFLTHLTKDDEAAFLGGAVRLDIINNGHFEYILVGKIRFIDDPFYKMSYFYHGDEEQINFDYVNEYTKDCILDILIMLREYSEDFYVIPIEYVKCTDEQEYYKTIKSIAEKTILSMFEPKYSSVDDYFSDNKSFEDIENNLLPYIKDQLVFTNLTDTQLSIRERCTVYLKTYANKMHFISAMDEPNLFFSMVIQYCMQAITIISTMKVRKMIPFIRDDISFRYFAMIFHSSIMREFSAQDYLNSYIPFVIQKAFDFSKYDYQFVKTQMGNGKMIHAILSNINESEISPDKIIKTVKDYIDHIQ